VSTGVEPDVAQDRVVHRAEVMADEDATLAMRKQSQASLAAIEDGEIHIIVGYRRIIHPELSHKTGVCALCLIASDRIYTVGELLPVHSGCHCTVVPIFHDSDPGDQLNQQDLAAIYKLAGSNRAGDLIKVRIHQHHELGAILTNAAHSFRPAPAGV
jgi:hypothetical protein